MALQKALEIGHRHRLPLEFSHTMLCGHFIRILVKRNNDCIFPVSLIMSENRQVLNVLDLYRPRVRILRGRHDLQAAEQVGAFFLAGYKIPV